MIKANKQFPEENIVRMKHVLGSQYFLWLLFILGIILALTASYLISEGVWFVVVAIIAMVAAILLLFAHPFSGVFLWLLIMPFISVLPKGELFYWAVYRLLPAFLLFLAIFSRTVNVRPHPVVRMGPPELAMIILLVFGTFSVFFSQTDTFVALVRFADRLILPFCMYLAIRLLAPRERDFRHLKWVALFIAISQSLIGLLSWFAPQVLPEVWHYLNGARTTGSLKDPNLYALMLVFSAIILVHAAVNEKSTLNRLIFFLAIGICALFAFLSLERASWLGGFFVTVGLVILYPKTMIKLLIICSILAVILSAGIFSAHVTLSIDRFGDVNPVYDRLVVFDAMAQMFFERPLLGWGYESLDEHIQPYYRQVGEASIATRLVTSHNTYMTVLAELGLIGFILYMFPVLWWLVLSIRVWGRIPKEGFWSRPLLGSLWLIMGFNFTICNFFDMRWFGIGLVLWWLVLGLIANMVYPHLKGRQQLSAVQPELDAV
ncbi:MAG TPA: O-antigen ligase family protein [Anaerolineaceae bacterium]|nr:O-antigen ligase family protein [Anaerolineaceae bacterium]